MTERLFAMLFVLDLVGLALALVVGLITLVLPGRRTGRPAAAPAGKVAHA